MKDNDNRRPGRIATFLSAALVLAFSTASSQAQACLDQAPADFNGGYTTITDLYNAASAHAMYMQYMGADPRALHAIMNASEQTGVDFELLLTKAMVESNLGREDRPRHIDASARGLFQYMPGPWLYLFAKHGADYNNGQYKNLAEKVRIQGPGFAYAPDDSVLHEILDLRHDFYLSAWIKAQQIKHEEKPLLTNMRGGREPENVDYYMIHLLGAPRAEVFYRNLRSNPNGAAANVMKKEARWNGGVFYDIQNRNSKRSFTEVRDFLKDILDRRMEEFNRNARLMQSLGRCIPPLVMDTPPEKPVGPRPIPRPKNFSISQDL